MNWRFVTAAVLLSGCDFTLSRPDQDNFTIHASKRQAERFIQSVSKRFDAPINAKDFNGLGNDPSRMFWLDGAKASLVVIPVPDDRCDPNASRHATFNQGEYGIDLVYRSRSNSERNSARRMLIQSAQDEGLEITEFKEC